MVSRCVMRCQARIDLASYRARLLPRLRCKVLLVVPGNNRKAGWSSVELRTKRPSSVQKGKVVSLCFVTDGRGGGLLLDGKFLSFKMLVSLRFSRRLLEQDSPGAGRRNCSGRVSEKEGQSIGKGRKSCRVRLSVSSFALAPGQEARGREGRTTKTHNTESRQRRQDATTAASPDTPTRGRGWIAGGLVCCTLEVDLCRAQNAAPRLFFSRSNTIPRERRRMAIETNRS